MTAKRMSAIIIVLFLKNNFRIVLLLKKKRMPAADRDGRLFAALMKLKQNAEYT